jgi:transposase
VETVYFLGVDIAKKTFDASLTIDAKAFDASHCENNANSIAAFFRDLKIKAGLSYGQLIVCMEHTGVYCLPLLNFLVDNRIKVCLEPALQIKRSQGLVRGKNDKVDAQRIATYAYKNREHLAFWKPQRLIIQKLKALLVTRDRLVTVKGMLSVPIQECEEFIDKSIHKSMAKSCHRSLKVLSEEIKRIEKSMEELVEKDDSLSRQVYWAKSVVGIGDIIALNMIVSTGEFERINKPKRFACYAGVAPFEHSSGSSVRGKTRVSKMANLTIKTLLTMGARSAILYDPELKAYAERKMGEGKHYFNVINAVRNKLITRVFACVTGKRLYQKKCGMPLLEP